MIAATWTTLRPQRLAEKPQFRNSVLSNPFPFVKSLFNTRLAILPAWLHFTSLAAYYTCIIQDRFLYPYFYLIHFYVELFLLPFHLMSSIIFNSIQIVIIFVLLFIIITIFRHQYNHTANWDNDVRYRGFYCVFLVTLVKLLFYK